MLKKAFLAATTLLGVVTFSLLVSFSVKPVYGANFSTDYLINYSVGPRGNATVNYQITLTNHTSDQYASEYTFSAYPANIEHVKAWDDQGPIGTSVSKDTASGELTERGLAEIKVQLDERTVGQDSKTTWYLQYDVPQLAQKQGRVWKLILPRLEHQQNPDNPAVNLAINSYRLQLGVSSTFGEPQYLIPQPSETKQEENSRVYIFQGNQSEQIRQKGLDASFGDYQLFDLDITYHLYNPLDSKAYSEIALVPNLPPVQKIYLESLTPRPAKIDEDKDGNYLATYYLDAKETLEIRFLGQAEVHLPQDRVVSKRTFSELHALYTSPAKFWETNADPIKQIVQEQTSPTQKTDREKARQLYNYTVNQLSYNENRFDQEVTRLGALKILEQKDNAVCMEFTDLLIALLRAADIPAREIDGYAYSPKTATDISGDVLHSWVQFFDQKKNAWHFVDPTWEATSGRNYFDILDTDRIIFVIKGIDSEKPYPAGSYKLAEESDARDIKISFSDRRSPAAIPFSLWKQNFRQEKARQNRGAIEQFFIWLADLVEKLRQIELPVWGS